MRSSRSLLLSQSIAVVLLVGCAAKPVPIPPPPPPVVASPDQQDKVQVDLSKFSANAHVGRVQQISPSDSLLAVTGIEVKDVKVGDVITIVDADDHILANGTVNSTYVAPDSNIPCVVVQYEAAPNAGRAPIKGDLAITSVISK